MSNKIQNENSSRLLIPPAFCQYANGPCNQDLSKTYPSSCFFIYANEPKTISSSIREAVRQLQVHGGTDNYQSWESLNVSGKIIFCQICKALRATKLVAADITTLNFNVLFEIGYAIGLGKSVLPLRDISYTRDKKLFEELGIFDVLGYESFQNSQTLVSIVSKRDREYPAIAREVPLNWKSPIYYLRSPVDSDGSIKLLSILKKGYFRFRTFDSRETPRLSLHEAYTQVHSSVGVVAHLMDPQRQGAQTHNARCAFVCGMAMAAKKFVLMLQEGLSIQPIDYRDVVLSYDYPEFIQPQVDKLLRAVAESFQGDKIVSLAQSRPFLEKVDIGDVAAENEILSLNDYFVKTPQFHQATTGHARLIVGRKGSGKTALFYAARKRLSGTKTNLVLDLKPEGHQFVRLREIVLSKMTEGMQLHTLTAFWSYLLLLEVAKKILDSGLSTAFHDPDTLANYRELENSFAEHLTDSEGDFSERVLRLVDKVVTGVSIAKSPDFTTGDITQIIYHTNISKLETAILQCLRKEERLWILIDNLDKGWSYMGAHREDIAILRCLLEATRKLGRWCDQHRLDFRSIVFLRKDIYDFLVDQTPDRGKEAVANLDWSDTELLKQLIAKRFSTNPDLQGGFEEVWPRVVNPHVFGENSFNYIIARTFLRPRDFLNFLRKSIEIAVSREHGRVEEEDIRTAELAFSEDMLNDLKYEMHDVSSDYPHVLEQFIGHKTFFSEEELDQMLHAYKVSGPDIGKIKDRLLWFCFLGYSVGDTERFAYQTMYNLPKLRALAHQNGNMACFVIHPAFRTALECAVV